MILVIDNYDSFVHNVARYCALLGHSAEVARKRCALRGRHRAHATRRDRRIARAVHQPDEAGVSKDAIEHLSGAVPILGVCLGHQCIGAVHGGRIARARHPMHGLSSDILHKGERLFAGLPSPLPVGRYHSLIVEATGSDGRRPDHRCVVPRRRDHGPVAQASSDLRGPVPPGIRADPRPVSRSSAISSPARPRGGGRGSPMLWLDGTLHATTIVPFDVADRGLLLGDGLFDTSLVLNGRMVWRAAHVARLAASAQVLGFAVDVVRIEAAIDAVLSSNRSRIAADHDHAWDRTARARAAEQSQTDDPRRRQPAARLGPVRTAQAARHGDPPQRDIARREGQRALAYIDGVLASREALAAGCDDALFLNTRGRVACTTVGKRVCPHRRPARDARRSKTASCRASPVPCSVAPATISGSSRSNDRSASKSWKQPTMFW